MPGGQNLFIQKTKVAKSAPLININEVVIEDSFSEIVVFNKNKRNSTAKEYAIQLADLNTRSPKVYVEARRGLYLPGTADPQIDYPASEIMNGMIFHNTTVPSIEIYIDDAWSNLLHLNLAGNPDRVLFVNSAGTAIDASENFIYDRSTLQLIRDEVDSDVSVEIASFTRTSTDPATDGIAGHITIGVEDASETIRGLTLGHILTNADANVNSEFIVQGFNNATLIPFVRVIGNYASVGDNNGSVVIGAESSIVSGVRDAVILGSNNTISADAGDESIVIGTSSTADNQRNVVIGSNASSSATTGIAIGYQAIISGNDTIAIGQETESVTSGNIAFGYRAGNTAGVQGTNAISIGTQANYNTGATNIGQDSIAIGQDTLAEDIGSIIIGGFTAASGSNYGIALGYQAIVENATSGIAIGYIAKSEANNVIAIGTNAGNTAGAKNIDAIMIGHDAGVQSGTAAYGQDSIAIGNATESPATSGIVIGVGSYNTAATSPISIGANSEALSDYNIGIGDNAGDGGAGLGGIAIGRRSRSNAQGAILMGYHSAALQTNSVANSFELAWDGSTRFKLGDTVPLTYYWEDAATNTSVEVARFDRTTSVTAADDIGSYIAMGVAGVDLRIEHTLDDSTTGLESSNFTVYGSDEGAANSPFLTVIGDGGLSNTWGVVTLGASATSAEANGIAIGRKAAVLSGGSGGISIGQEAGTGTTVGQNAISIGASSNGVSTIGLNSVAIGVSSQSRSDRGVAIGDSALVTAVNGIAIGQNTKAADVNGIAVGLGAEAEAADAIAIGTDAGDTGSITKGINSISIGLQANSDSADIGANSIGIGNAIQSSGSDTVAIGTGVWSIGISSIGIGNAASSTDDYSVGIGDTSDATGVGSIAIGRLTNTTAQGAIMMGYHSVAQTNSVANSFELAWDGATALHVIGGASKVNYLQIDSSLTTVGPVISAQGETDVNILLHPKGATTGVVRTNSTHTANIAAADDVVTKGFADATYSVLAHTHLLAAGATDVTATAAELNVLDLSATSLTAGWVYSADGASTASWKAPSAGSGQWDDNVNIEFGTDSDFEMGFENVGQTLVINGTNSGDNIMLRAQGVDSIWFDLSDALIQSQIYGSATAPNYSTFASGGAKSGMYSTADNQLQFSVNGVEDILMTTSTHTFSPGGTTARLTMTAAQLTFNPTTTLKFDVSGTEQVLINSTTQTFSPGGTDNLTIIDGRVTVAKRLNLGKGGDLTPDASHIITVTHSYHIVITAVAVDRLDMIDGGSEGDILVLQKDNSTNDLDIKSETGGTTDNQVHLNGTNRILGGDGHCITLIRAASGWYPIGLYNL